MDAYYIPIQPDNPHAVAFKAMSDLDYVFHEKGIIPLVSPVRIDPSHDNRARSYLKKAREDILKASSALEDKMIFIQYPTAMGNLAAFPALAEKMAKGSRLVIFIHDLNGIRFKSPLVSWADKRVFQCAWLLVSHNQAMTEYLVKKMGISPDKIIDLGLFDYLTDKINRKERKKDDGLAFAGNLKKSSPLLSKYIAAKIPVRLNLYGYKAPGLSFDSENSKYFGSFPPDTVQMELVGGFGLVWDGKSIDGCTGIYGNYLRYNNPHKASLYIIAGLPLVVSSDSALAEMVAKQQIGLTVKSLRELPQRIGSLSADDYGNMRKNVLSLAAELAQGGHGEKAVEEILRRYKPNN
jgi:hypothetical protein